MAVSLRRTARRPRSTSAVRDPGASMTSSFYDAGGNPIADPDAYVGQLYDSGGQPWIDTINVNEPTRTFIPGDAGQANKLYNMPDRRAPIMDPTGVTQDPASQLRGSPFEGPYQGVPGLRSPLAQPPPNFDPNTAQAWADYLETQGQDNAALNAEIAQQDIDQKELDLRQAMLDGDAETATRLIGEIQAAKDYMKRSFEDYRRTVTPVYDDAIYQSGLIQDNNTQPLADIAIAEQGGINAAFAGANADVGKEAQLVGADAQAAAAAKAIAGELTGLYLETSEGRQDDAQRILSALENAAVESSKAFKAEDLWNIDNRERIDQAARDQDLRNAQEGLADLNYRQQLFDLDRERTNIAHAETLRRLRETGSEDPFMDSVGFGQLAATKYLHTQLDAAGTPLDRQSILIGVMEEAWTRGIFSPGELDKYLNVPLEDGVLPMRESYGYPPLTDGEVDLLTRAMGAYGNGRDQYNTLASVSGSGGSSAAAISAAGGSSSGSSSGGQAPANQANAAAARRGEGEYGARARRVASLKDELMGMFDVNFMGQWRDLDAKVTADRSANSDHYSGGALDFSGTEAEMQNMKTYLEARSDVSFVKIHGNPRHVHVSFRL